MPRLPIPGSDDNHWGDILNTFLNAEHNSDGTHRNDTSVQKIEVARNNTLVGTRKRINFIQGDSTTIVAADNSGAGQVDITIGATSNAPWFNVKNAPFNAIGDGTANDSPAIQAAITAAVAAGGTVYLPQGTYRLAASLTIPTCNAFTMIGDGWTTILRLANGVNAYAITFVSTSGSISGASFSNFTVQGNSPNQTSGGGIHARGAVDCVFDHLHIFQGYNAGLFLDGIQAGGFGHNNVITSCLFDGGQISTGEGLGIRIHDSDENSISHCHFNDLGGVGSEVGAIRDEAGLTSITSCAFVGGKEGIRVKDTGGTRIASCMFDGTGRTSIHLSAYSVSIIGNRFTSGNNQPPYNNYSYIVNDNDGRNTVIGNNFTSPASGGQLRSFLRMTGATNNNVVVGNRFNIQGALGTALIERDGDGLYRDNSGYTTENAGTATIANGTTSVVVSHGLDVTPTVKDLSVSPTNSLGNAAKFWVSNPTSTQFTIAVNADPGATTATFAWRCVV